MQISLYYSNMQHIKISHSLYFMLFSKDSYHSCNYYSYANVSKAIFKNNSICHGCIQILGIYIIMYAITLVMTRVINLSYQVKKNKSL